MKPYLLKLPLQRKEPELRFDACQVDYVIELPKQEFYRFQHSLLADYDFLREFNEQYASTPVGDVRPGLLVLGADHDDGIFVCTEGYNYARYSAHVPNARQILLLKEYPALKEHGENLARLADKYIQQAINIGLPDDFHISVYELDADALYNRSNDELFAQMLANRPEVESVEIDRDEIRIRIDPEYLPRRQLEPKTLSEEEFKIACAKHLLWCHGVGGERADFSNCKFENVNFSRLELNSAIFDGALFQNCDLSDLSACFASFQRCVFRDCSCRRLTAEEAVFRDAVLDRCDLTGAFFTHSDFTHAALQGCKMDGASLRNCLTEDMSTSDTRLDNADLHGTTEDGQSWQQAAEHILSEEGIQ